MAIQSQRSTGAGGGVNKESLTCETLSFQWHYYMPVIATNEEFSAAVNALLCLRVRFLSSLLQTIYSEAIIFFDCKINQKQGRSPLCGG